MPEAVENSRVVGFARVLPSPDSASVAGALLAVAAYAAVRTLSMPDAAVYAWAACAVVMTLVSPLAGLTIVAAIAPFTGALNDDGSISAMPFLLAGLGAALALRMALAVVNGVFPSRRDLIDWWPALVAVALMGGTALGVLNSWLSYGPERGREAAELWVPGLGGAMTVFLISAWVARRGELRPLLVVVASVTLAAALSIADYLSGGGVSDTPLHWLLHEARDAVRLGGIISAPNAAATIFLLVVALAAAAIVHARESRVRVCAAIAGGIALFAVVLTFSRSALIAIGVIVTIVAIRWKRNRAIAIAAVAVPLLVGVSMVGIAREVAPIGDQQRLTAWIASLRMFAAHPLQGAGFRSFEWLHAEYGSPSLDAPHNEWLRLFAEEGIALGLAGLALAIAVPIVLVRRGGWIGMAAAAAAASAFVMAGFNNPFLYTQVNAPLFMVLGTGVGWMLRHVDVEHRASCRTPPPRSIVPTSALPKVRPGAPHKA